MTGDGAGIHVEIPQEFFREHVRRTGNDLVGGRLAVGQVFLPKNDMDAQERRRTTSEISVGG
jgi:glutamate synthase (NADPH/NADH) large chain